MFCGFVVPVPVAFAGRSECELALLAHAVETLDYDYDALASRLCIRLLESNKG